MAFVGQVVKKLPAASSDNRQRSSTPSNMTLEPLSSCFYCFSNRTRVFFPTESANSIDKPNQP